MAERRQWVKLWASWYTTASHLSIGAFPLHVGAVLMTCVSWEPGADEAWAEFDSGLPMSVEAIALRCQASPREVLAALRKLQERGTVGQRADGAWGLVRFGRWQESPDAARKRNRRGHSADKNGNGGGHSADFPDEAEAEAEAENSLRSSTPNPSAEGDSPPGLIGAETPAELIERSKPRRKVKPRADLPEGLAEHVLAEFALAKRTLDGPTAGPRHTAQHPPFLDQLAKLHAAHAPTPEEWSAVIAERLALSREARRTGQPEFGSLTVASLCVPANFERWLASSRARASGRSSAPVVRRGPAPPSPRPTSSGAVDLDGGDA